MARLSSGRLTDFLVAAAIFGFAAVWAVPWVAGALMAVTPQTWQSKLAPYIPSSKAPGFTLAAAGQAVVFGVFLALVLMLLRRFGVRKHVDGIEA